MENVKVMLTKKVKVMLTVVAALVVLVLGMAPALGHFPNHPCGESPYVHFHDGIRWSTWYYTYHGGYSSGSYWDEYWYWYDYWGSSSDYWEYGGWDWSYC